MHEQDAHSGLDRSYQDRAGFPLSKRLIGVLQVECDQRGTEQGPGCGWWLEEIEIC